MHTDIVVPGANLASLPFVGRVVTAVVRSLQQVLVLLRRHSRCCLWSQIDAGNVMGDCFTVAGRNAVWLQLLTKSHLILRKRSQNRRLLSTLVQILFFAPDNHYINFVQLHNGSTYKKAATDNIKPSAPVYHEGRAYITKVCTD